MGRGRSGVSVLQFANEALRGNEYPDGATTSVTLTGLTEGATYKVKARTRYSSGRANNRRWSGPWSDVVTASVSEAAPVAQQQIDDPQTQGDDQQQVDDPQTQNDDQQQVEDPVVVDPVSQSKATTSNSSATTRLPGPASLLRPARRCLRLA